MYYAYIYTIHLWALTQSRHLGVEGAWDTQALGALKCLGHSPRTLGHSWRLAPSALRALALGALGASALTASALKAREAFRHLRLWHLKHLRHFGTYA